MKIRPTTSLTARLRTLLAGTFLLLALVAPPAAFADDHLPAVTPEMVDSESDDYDEGAVDLAGMTLFKHIQFNGTEGLDENQIAAAEGYADRYELSLIHI